MKKFSYLLATALPVLMLGACASTGGSDNTYSSEALVEDAPASPSAFHPGRNPSGLASCSDSSFTTDSTPVDPAAHWEAGSFTPSIGVNGGRATKQVLVNQVISLKNRFDCNDTCYQWQKQQYVDPQGWYDYSVCEASGNLGESEAWKTYFTVPMAEKAKKLDDAIKGIGPTNAESLVKHHVFFDGKPRSWSAFVRIMRDAQSRDYLNPGVFDLVTTKYANENMRSLGYDPGTCVPVHHTEYQYVWTQVPYTCPGSRYAIEKRNISTASLPVTINVGPSVLQSFERDHVGVTVDYNGQNFTVRDSHASSLNRYYFSDRADIHAPGAIVNQPLQAPNGTQNLDVFFTEGGRNLVDLPSDIVGNVQLNSAVNSVIFVVPVNLGQRQPSGPNDQMVVSYSVEQCDLQGHWYTAGIRTCGKYYTVQPLKDVPLNDGVNTVQTIASDANHKIRVTYHVSRRNSRYYNNSPLAARPLEQKAHK